jgi:signal transduction histidine kinase
LSLAGAAIGKWWAPGAGLVVALFGALACWQRVGRGLRSTFVTLGLLGSSAILVQLSGGRVEAHFHVFVMLAFLALAQDWIAYGVAAAFVAAHHGAAGLLWPEALYGDPAAWQAPWRWAGVHVLSLLCACLAGLLAWRYNDRAFASRTAAALQHAERETEDTLTRLAATQDQLLQRERLRAMGRMASGIAHDFNNTLSPIVGFTELLLRQPGLPPETVHSYLQVIATAAHDAASLVRRIRELNRERGESDAEGPVDLSACIQDAVALTRPRWRDAALESGIDIRVAIDAPAAPVIRGDAEAIREMLTNLIVNAVEAMPQGGTITLRAHPVDAEAVIEVLDTGIGMSEDVRQRCLEPFFSTKGRRGIGLGLSLVYATLERHGGSVRVESEPGRGSRFIVRLPIPRPASADGAADDAAAQPLHVLLVEDDPLARISLMAQLSSQGHRVAAATNGVEGLARFSADRFDLVVTDRAMPGMGGDELAASIASSAPGTPIIMLTGFGDLMDARGERPAGVGAVVSKPVTLDTLAQAIRVVTARR